MKICLLTCVWIFLFISCSTTKKTVDAEREAELLEEGKILVRIDKMPEADARLGQVTGIIEASPESVWKLISDYNDHKNYMPNLRECFAIRPEALELLAGMSPGDLPKLESLLRQHKTNDVEGKVVYTYSVGDFPWPMSDKRYVLRNERDAERFTTHSTMVIGQMSVNESWWELKSSGPAGSKTLATYKVLLDAGAAIPGFAVDMAANSTLPEVIKAVRKRVQDPR